jgi:hypothetical protein
VDEGTSKVDDGTRYKQSGRRDVRREQKRTEEEKSEEKRR